MAAPDAATLLGDQHWVRSNSRWRYWTWTWLFVWVAFMWSGMRARRPRWVALGFAYSLPFIASGVIDGVAGEGSEDTVAGTIAMIAMTAVWPLSILHARHLLPQYLSIRAGIESGAGATAAAAQAAHLPGGGRPPAPAPGGAGPAAAPTSHPVVADARHASAAYFADSGESSGPPFAAPAGLERWRSPEHPTAPDVRHVKVDVNRAGEAELADLPGIGPVLAKRAVALRDSTGDFASVDAFGTAVGLKPHVLERLRPMLVATVPPPMERTKGRVLDL